MKPQRIQRKRTKGWRMPPNTFYTGRPSKWGNPFLPNKTIKIGNWWDEDFQFKLTTNEAVQLYEMLFCKEKKEEIIKELKGKNLACWCPLDQPCHADILLKIANKP